MLASGTLKNFMFLLKSFLFTERAPVMKLTCSTFQPSRCISPLKALRRDAYWSSASRFALTTYFLCSRMQKTPVLFPKGGSTVIP